MALPTFVSVSTIAGSSATPSPSWPTHDTDDIALLFVESANQAIRLSTANGFAEISGLQNGGGTAGSEAAAEEYQ